MYCAVEGRLNSESITHFKPLPLGGKLVEHRQPRLFFPLLVGQHICRQRPPMCAHAMGSGSLLCRRASRHTPRYLQDLIRLFRRDRLAISQPRPRRDYHSHHPHCYPAFRGAKLRAYLSQVRSSSVVRTQLSCSNSRSLHEPKKVISQGWLRIAVCHKHHPNSRYTLAFQEKR